MGSGLSTEVRIRERYHQVSQGELEDVVLRIKWCMLPLFGVVTSRTLNYRFHFDLGSVTFKKKHLESPEQQKLDLMAF